MGTGDDLLKGASRLFAKVGGTVMQAGKQVTGLGLGTVRVGLPRTKFAPGDTIKGSVVLALPEPLDGKRLAVGIRASQKIVEHTAIATVRIPSTTIRVVYKHDHELGGAQHYSSGEHPFELTVPADALELNARAGVIEWRVFAVFEIPWSQDLDHSVDLVVAP